MSKTTVTLSLWQTFQKNNAHTHTPVLKWAAASLSDSVVPAVKKWKHHLIMHAVFFFSEFLSLQTFNVCQYTLLSSWVHGHMGRMTDSLVCAVHFRRLTLGKWNIENIYYFNLNLNSSCPGPDVNVHQSRCLSDTQVLSFTSLLILAVLLLVTLQNMSCLWEAVGIITFKKNQLAHCLGSASCVYFHNPFSFCSPTPPYKSTETGRQSCISPFHELLPFW